MLQHSYIENLAFGNYNSFIVLFRCHSWSKWHVMTEVLIAIYTWNILCINTSSKNEQHFPNTITQKINGDICANVSFLETTLGWVKPWKILAQRKFYLPFIPLKKIIRMWKQDYNGSCLATLTAMFIPLKAIIHSCSTAFFFQQLCILQESLNT